MLTRPMHIAFAGTLLLVYSFYPCIVRRPLHNFRPEAECVNVRKQRGCFCLWRWWVKVW